MHRIVFVTGSDTGVGKTVVSVLATRALREAGCRVRAVKPFCSGGREDAVALQSAEGLGTDLDRVNPWHFRAPLTPLLAARREGKRVRLEATLKFLRQAARDAEVLVVEGAGGLLSPLGEGFAADALIRGLRAQPLVVCPDRLGAINQARLVVGALPAPARARAVVALVRPECPDGSVRTNRRMLEELLGTGRVIRVPWLGARVSDAPVPVELRRWVRQVFER